MCGENSCRSVSIIRSYGSSPRVRGKLRHSSATSLLRGLIPACAGKTEMALLDRLFLWAHPRVCGENYMNRLTDVQDTGSSPRVRGKQRVCILSRFISGLIPACAGKTLAASKSQSDNTAHPRVCGENSRPEVRQSTAPGSSPRVRGKH